MTPQVHDAALHLARAYLSRYLALHAARRKGGTAYGPSSEEIAIALGRVAAQPPADLVAAEEERLGAARAAFAAWVAATPDARLPRLAAAFSLSPLDVEIACILVAPELDHDLERAFCYALDDFTRKRPDLAFLARVVGGADPELADRVLRRLDDGPLRRAGIVAASAPTPGAPATSRTIRLGDRIIAFLRGHDTLDESVAAFVRVGAGSVLVTDLVMPPEMIARVRRALASEMGAPRVLLVGPEGVGRGRLVEAIYAEQNRPTLRVDLAAIAEDGGMLAERLASALREAALRDAAVILEGGNALDREAPRALGHAIADAAQTLDVPLVFTLGGHPSWLVHAVPGLVELDLPPPTFRERVELWRRALPVDVTSTEDIEVVASRYSFTAGTISRAAYRAYQSARLRDPDAPRVSLDDLGDAARLMFSHRLGGMAQRIPTGFAWTDLVLPQDTLDAVREVVRFARFRPFLLEDWGFAAKLPYGRGVSAILAGPPGTGKTMVAQLLARELGYDLYRIDLSQVVNKYIGETEKNLARIFDEAETSHAVLFFDEADSLFAKRTEVRSSNDRYANLEVNYLLQRMETFDGVTLLATNLEQGLDEAFKRRVRFSVQFELPEEAERLRLWQSMFPPKVPLAADIDWTIVARQFVMAGGYIKKAALRAALLAAETRRPITTADLLEAARLEYREMGRII
jgi:hypothetical protein